jgi:two-component system chemotaxis response regulator CheB
MNRIKVLIVDDSALIRNLLTELLQGDKDIEVVGTASDPYVAREKIKALNPDVITLDVEMPRMDGLTFLRNLMRLRPMPVVMISSLTEKGADVTLQALELGAVDFITKPKLDVKVGMEAYQQEIIDKVKSAAGAKVLALSAFASNKNLNILNVSPKLGADAVISEKLKLKHYKTTEKIIAIGASTGGTEAIREVLRELPADMPGIVISQHIPAAFSGPFAQRLNRELVLTVSEALDGEQILPGHVYIAPGDRHLLVERSGARYICRLNDGPLVNRHKPSVDVMFRSVAQNVGPNAIGVILTGMGDDGARGLLEMKNEGAKTIAQDEKSSVVWGMPGEAVKRGGAIDILPLDKIDDQLIKLR